MHPIDYVRKFHELFEHPIKPVPTFPSPERRLLRVRLLLEEVAEFCKASGYPIEVLVDTARGMVPYKHVTIEDAREREVDLVEAADGLADVQVICNGSALEWGFPMPALDAEVSRSNLSKLGADGKPIRDQYGKTIKGPNYSPPNIEGVLYDAGWDGIRYLEPPPFRDPDRGQG